MTVADDHLARFAPVLDEADREDAARDPHHDLPDCVRDALALSEALQPVVPIAIKLGAGQAPGMDPGEDASWAASVAWARRRVHAQRARGIDHGLAEDNLRLLDRIEALLRGWPEDCDDAVRHRVRGLVEACRRGRERGEQLRQSAGRVEVEDGSSVGWLLRHPTDHWLTSALPAVSDSECRALIESQIAKLAPGYQQLSGLDCSGEEASADVVCEMEVAHISPVRWKEPVSAVMTAPIKGHAPTGEEIGVRLVEDPKGPFNGTLVSLLPGERWRMCARRLTDDTLLPLDGTRRLGVSGP